MLKKGTYNNKKIKEADIPFFVGLYNLCINNELMFPMDTRRQRGKLPLNINLTEIQNPTIIYNNFLKKNILLLQLIKDLYINYIQIGIIITTIYHKCFHFIERTKQLSHNLFTTSSNNNELLRNIYKTIIIIKDKQVGIPQITQQNNNFERYIDELVEYYNLSVDIVNLIEVKFPGNIEEFKHYQTPNHRYQDLNLFEYINIEQIIQDSTNINTILKENNFYLTPPTGAAAI